MVEDVWHDNYSGAPPRGNPWNEGGDDRYRVLRGGSWGDDPRNCRSANRIRNGPDVQNINLGFRVVCASPRIS
ncbi:MAG: SUMF1/EgtB/PvdO family nonheme iron enzyme [Cyanobacteria bacterium P01_D01_bin.123]